MTAAGAPAVAILRNKGGPPPRVSDLPPHPFPPGWGAAARPGPGCRERGGACSEDDGGGGPGDGDLAKHGWPPSASGCLPSSPLLVRMGGRRRKGQVCVGNFPRAVPPPATTYWPR